MHCILVKHFSNSYKPYYVTIWYLIYKFEILIRICLYKYNMLFRRYLDLSYRYDISKIEIISV